MIFDWLKLPDKYFSSRANKVKPTLAATLAAEDVQADAACNGRRFSVGSRPVIRWIKGDGLDDMVTRAAIGQATRIFGSEVDYCICTQGIDADRVRCILEWASQPVEWWPVTEDDNPQLAQLLIIAGCEPTNFGYWWKWFPERVRPDAPEWILDGDMVITGKPDWFQKWTEGVDVVRVSQDDAESPHIYGNYSSQVNLDLMLYSGLVSLPPKCNYMPQIVEVLTLQPLLTGHDGKKDMSEQGVIAAAFQKLHAQPIPLYEFPFCRAFQDYIDFGLKGDQGRVWGYHFGNSFIMENPHFERLTKEEIFFSKHESSLMEKFQWLGAQGQWGIPGWTITDECAKIILDLASDYEGKHVLEIGTSRGRLSAMLATLGCTVTTIDHIDRDARKNLQNLTVEVIIDDAIHFLETNEQYFDLIICDLHGNSATEWKQFSKPLMKRVRSGSTLIISNALLSEIPKWHQETGVQWFLKQIAHKWSVTLYDANIPGIAVVNINKKNEMNKRNRHFSNWFSGVYKNQHYVSKTRIFHFIWKHLKTIRDIKRISRSGYFDKKYYLQNNPDVKESGMSAIKHYLLFGGIEGRKPCMDFDSSFYLEQNSDVKEAGMNPLLHYLKHGITECRNIFPEKCNISSSVPKNLKSETSEFSQVGKKIIERFKGFQDVQLIRNSEYFDSEYYLTMNPDLKVANVDPAEHYLFHGWMEGRNPSVSFNTSFYLQKYEDIQRSDMNPLIHFIKYGESENRHCSEKSGDDYLLWIKKYDTLSCGDIEEMKQSVSLFDAKPLISVVMPVFNPNPAWIKEAINSVINQVYPYWELCIADDCSSDKEIKEILEYYRITDSRIKVIYRTSNGHISAASNSALTLASGEFVALLDHDDILPIHALYWVANTINQNPGVKLIYSDEDKIDENGVRQNPYFKCDWNPELFYSQNMISHFGIYHTEMLSSIGGFRTGFEGSQDYDLALRCIENIEPKSIFHIPKVLYHWRLHSNSTSSLGTCKEYAFVAGEKALNEHFIRTNRMAWVNFIRPSQYRLHYQLPESAPQITLIIPTKNQTNLLRRCIQSVLDKTKYTAFDIIIINNGSDESELFQYLFELRVIKRVTCIEDDRPFNYSALNNMAVAAAKGEYVCLLNNDTEVINPDWLSEMVAIAVQPGIGAVGAKLYYPDDKIQHAGVLLGVGGIANHAHKSLPSDTYGYFGRAVLMQEMSAVTGACLVVKKTIYQEVGGMDELNLPVAFNDVDFCLRLKKAGYRNIWTPYAEMYHHESVTRGKDDTVTKSDRFKKEITYMKEAWGVQLQYDPAYNPNLSLSSEKFELAWPPRKYSIQ